MLWFRKVQCHIANSSNIIIASTNISSSSFIFTNDCNSYWHKHCSQINHNILFGYFLFIQTTSTTSAELNEKWFRYLSFQCSSINIEIDRSRQIHDDFSWFKNDLKNLSQTLRLLNSKIKYYDSDCKAYYSQAVGNEEKILLKSKAAVIKTILKRHKNQALKLWLCRLIFWWNICKYMMSNVFALRLYLLLLLLHCAVQKELIVFDISHGFVFPLNNEH